MYFQLYSKSASWRFAVGASLLTNYEITVKTKRCAFEGMKSKISLSAKSYEFKRTEEEYEERAWKLKRHKGKEIGDL